MSQYNLYKVSCKSYDTNTIKRAIISLYNKYYPKALVKVNINHEQITYTVMYMTNNYNNKCNLIDDNLEALVIKSYNIIIKLISSLISQYTLNHQVELINCNIHFELTLESLSKTIRIKTISMYYYKDTNNEMQSKIAQPLVKSYSYTPALIVKPVVKKRIL